MKKLLARNIWFVTVGCFFFTCSKTGKVAPAPDEEDPPYIWPQTSINDIRNLQIVPYFRGFVVGRAQYVSHLMFENWFSEPISKPDLGEIVPRDVDINLITVGGGLTAGAQNGGLFRDGQLSAYPNLIAKQLGISDFKTPLFDQAHANGTGFSITDGNKSETFFKVDNNLGTIHEEENGKPLALAPYEGQVNNYSAPWLASFQIFDSIWREEFISQLANANGVSWPPFLPYVARFIPIEHFKNETLFNYITDYQPYNFFILESVAEVFLNNIRLKGSRVLSLSDLIGDIQTGENYTLKAIQKFRRNGANGVIFTVPHFRHLGVATWDTEILKPEELAQYETGVDITNKLIWDWAKLTGVAVVDLDKLYKEVKDGRIKIGSSMAVTGEFNGNFFSCDGIYPSTLGQAIVANEVIKAINLQFKSNVQLIDIEKYLLSINFSN